MAVRKRTGFKAQKRKNSESLKAANKRLAIANARIKAAEAQTKAANERSNVAIERSKVAKKKIAKLKRDSGKGKYSKGRKATQIHRPVKRVDVVKSKSAPKIYQMESGQSTAQMGIGPFKTIWSLVSKSTTVATKTEPDGFIALGFKTKSNIGKKRGWTEATHPTLAEQTRPVKPQEIHTKMVGGKAVLDSKAAGEWFGGYIRHAQPKGYTRRGGGMKGLPTFDRNMGFPGRGFDEGWGQNIVQKSRLEQGQVLGKTLKKDIKLTAQGKKYVPPATTRKFSAKVQQAKKITSSDLNKIWNGLPSEKQLQIIKSQPLVGRYGFPAMSFDVKQAILKQAGLVA